jgi:threonylcarbamoyladenosine tRNA methylthiotransferase MtaB
LTDEIIRITAQSEKLCNHFHIPLQSGSPSILKAMQRRYSVDDYKRIIDKLNSNIPDVGIGVDVIVGFPGESEENFWETYNFIKDLPVSYLHVFTYSERPDTKAVALPGKVEITDRKKRNSMLRILSEKKRRHFYSQMIGKELEVLFEAENIDGLIKGFSSNYVRVQNEFAPSLINDFSFIHITDLDENLCKGILIETKKSVEL